MITSDSIVVTDGLVMKKAEDIVVGDKVVSYNNKCEEVLEIIKTEHNGDIYRIQSQPFSTLYTLITPDTKLFCTKRFHLKRRTYNMKNRKN